VSKKGSQKGTEANAEEEHPIHVFDSGLLGSSLVLRFTSSNPWARKTLQCQSFEGACMAMQVYEQDRHVGK